MPDFEKSQYPWRTILTTNTLWAATKRMRLSLVERFGEPVGKAEVEAAFERWAEWRGLAYWFWDWKE